VTLPVCVWAQVAVPDLPSWEKVGIQTGMVIAICTLAGLVFKFFMQYRADMIAMKQEHATEVRLMLDHAFEREKAWAATTAELKEHLARSNLLHEGLTKALARCEERQTHHRGGH
jgi:hypothetical protein